MKRFEHTEPVESCDASGTEYVGVHVKDNVFQTEAGIFLKTNIEQGKIDISINRVDTNNVNRNEPIDSLKDMLRFVMYGDNNKELNEERSVDKKTYWPKARYINSDGSISELITDHGFDNAKGAEKRIYEWKKEYGFDISEAWIEIHSKRTYGVMITKKEIIRRYPNERH